MSSGNSRSSKRAKRAALIESAAVLLCVAAISAMAVWWFHSHGYTLYYGDAEAHLNSARRLVDSRTPGYAQIGTVWLPIPHVVMLPFISKLELWRSGLAGAIPSAACFVLAGCFLYAAARRALAWRSAAIAALCLFVLNPNVLYLQAIPMTEAVFFLSLFGMLYGAVWFRERHSTMAVVATGFFSILASLTRYEGWVAIPLLTGYFFVAAGKRGWRCALLFGFIASLAPVYWLAHNYWYYGDALEFYRGQWSAKAIYQRALDAGMARYPGDHEWGQAVRYFTTAVRLCAGIPLVCVGVAGLVAAVLKRAWLPLALLVLVPVFYIVSLYTSGTPIFVPQLWPHGHYNTRYATAAIPLLAFSGAALVALFPVRVRPVAAAVVILAAISPWLAYPRSEAWICWKESKVNSDARRDWTSQGAGFLAAEYQSGQGVFTMFGDMMGIFREAGIPFRETLNDSNGKIWDLTLMAPNQYLREEWVVAYAGDPVTVSLQRAARRGLYYDVVKRIQAPGAQVVEIYRKRHEDTVHKSPRGEE